MLKVLMIGSECWRKLPHLGEEGFEGHLLAGIYVEKLCGADRPFDVGAVIIDDFHMTPNNAGSAMTFAKVMTNAKVVCHLTEPLRPNDPRQQNQTDEKGVVHIYLPINAYHNHSDIRDVRNSDWCYEAIMEKLEYEFIQAIGLLPSENHVPATLPAV